MGPSVSVCRVFNHMFSTMALDQIVATLTCDATVQFVILSVHVLRPLSVLWPKQHLWNFYTLQSCIIILPSAPRSST